MIRIGRRAYIGKRFVDPPLPDGFIKIIVMIKEDLKNNEYGSLSPYSITDEFGFLIENRWQFSKVYPTVPDTKQPYSINNPQIIWQHPKEDHIDANGNVTQDYLVWRKKGMQNKDPVRYPVGMKFRHTCAFSLLDVNPQGIVTNKEKLNYVDARKQIYLKYYCGNVKDHPHFKLLKTMLDNGQNIMIVEVDGPHQESLDYYKSNYNVKDDFIVNSSIECNIQNMKILLNDTKHAFGHGYCLGIQLLGITADVCKN